MNASIRSFSMSRCLAVFGALFLLLYCANGAWAQFAAAYDPLGVDVDPNGVLRSKTTKKDPRLEELRKKARHAKKDEQLRYISLPRVFAEARKYLEADKPLPDDLRYLGGITQLRYIFVYPEEGDIVIAGPAEPFDSSVPFRPLGKYSGRPVLHLDDLVTALRACGPGKKPDRIGCDILVTKEIAERIGKKASQVVPKAQFLGAKKAADDIAQAGGQQPVQFYAVDTSTRFAFVCVEADYRLKQLALGLFKSPVRKVRSYNSMISRPEKGHRFSLESSYDALLVSPDGNSFELSGPSLKINSGVLFAKGAAAEDISPAARRFMVQCNKNFEDLCREMVCWADLSNLADLSVLAALIGGESIHEKISWDISWILDREKYLVPRMDTPKTAQTLCNYNYAGRMILFTSGGVLLNPSASAEKRICDTEGKLKDMPDRPQGDKWSTSRKLR